VAKLSDLYIRDDIQRMLKRLNGVFDNYSKLDDNIYLLRKNQNELKKIIKDYRGKLSMVEDFMSGSKYNVVGNSAAREFEKALTSFPEIKNAKIAQGHVDKILSSIKAEYSVAMSGIMDTVVHDVSSKIAVTILLLVVMDGRKIGSDSLI